MAPSKVIEVAGLAMGDLTTSLKLCGFNGYLVEIAFKFSIKGKIKKFIDSAKFLLSLFGTTTRHPMGNLRV